MGSLRGKALAPPCGGAFFLGPPKPATPKTKGPGFSPSPLTSTRIPSRGQGGPEVMQELLQALPPLAILQGGYPLG